MTYHMFHWEKPVQPPLSMTVKNTWLPFLKPLPFRVSG